MKKVITLLVRTLLLITLLLVFATGNYRLESSANIQAVKKALVKKDVIEVDDREITFNDSLFKLWLKRQRL